LSSIWNTLCAEKSNEWLFGKLEPSQIPFKINEGPIQVDQEYIDVFLRSMRIVHVRKGTKKFFGAVHSFITLPILNQTGKFHVLTTPTDLSNIDASNVDRIIQINKRLLGPIPYGGGDLTINIGLFSIESADLTGPFLKVLENMSTTAGVSFVKSAFPFANILTEGVNLLFGAGNSNCLEVGLSTTFNELHSGYFVVMRASKGDVAIENLSLDKDFRLIGKTKKGSGIDDFPYIVFSIESSPKRAWRDIPEIADGFKQTMDFVRIGDVNGANAAFTAFRRIVLTSPDLVSDDAAKIVSEVDKTLEKLLVPCKQASKTEIKVPTIDEIEIYK
jgi:hypothetical protein